MLTGMRVKGGESPWYPTKGGNSSKHCA